MSERPSPFGWRARESQRGEFPPDCDFFTGGDPIVYGLDTYDALQKGYDEFHRVLRRLYSPRRGAWLKEQTRLRHCARSARKKLKRQCRHR